MVDVRDTAHDDEGQVVQKPADDGVDTGVVDLIDVGLLELVETALPADCVPANEEGEESERGSAAPVYSWVAEEEVLYDYGRG